MCFRHCDDQVTVDIYGGEINGIMGHQRDIRPNCTTFRGKKASSITTSFIFSIANQIKCLIQFYYYYGSRHSGHSCPRCIRVKYVFCFFFSFMIRAPLWST